MNYEDAGYDQFLNKSLPSFADPMSSEDTGSLLMPRISGSSLVSGKSLSNDGKLIINWDTGEVIFSDGARGRVFLGRIEGSDNYGIKIVDAEGNIVLSTTGEIQTEGLADSAVTTVKINALAVTTAKINNLAVTESIIAGNAVTASKINVTNLQAVSANMGTVNVGGSGNGNGILNVKDTAGNNKVVLNSDGITINSGKMIIKDDDEATIIDAKGLVSTANFSSGNITSNSTDSFTDASWAATQYSSTLSFTTVRDNLKLLILCNLGVFGGGSYPWSGGLSFGISFDDGDPATPFTISVNPFHQFIGGTDNNSEITATHIFSITGIMNIATAGAHTIRIKRYRYDGDVVGYLGSFSLTYVMLGV